MLAADKLQLQSQLKQQAVSLKEKEFNLHHSNLMTVGTQAAVLAGLDITMLIEFTPRDNLTRLAPWILHSLAALYYGMITAAFCSNLMVVSQTTVLSVAGAGLALRGPDGSMMVATDVLYQERVGIFTVFGRGLALTAGAVLVAVWLLLDVEAAAACFVVAAVGCYNMYYNYRRVLCTLEYDERDTVDFRDIMDGPGNVRLMQQRRSNNNQYYKQHQKNSYRRAKSASISAADDEYEEEDSTSYEGSTDDLERQDQVQDRSGNASRRRNQGKYHIRTV